MLTNNGQESKVASCAIQADSMFHSRSPSRLYPIRLFLSMLPVRLLLGPTTICNDCNCIVYIQPEEYQPGLACFVDWQRPVGFSFSLLLGDG